MAIRRFTLVAGLLFLFVGIFAFIPGVSTPPHGMDPDLIVESAHGRLFGLFPVNIIHNLVHIALGVLAIIAAKTVEWSKVYCRGAAIIYAALALIGMFPGFNILFGLVPLHGHNVWLHIVFAMPLAYFGFVKADIYRGYEKGQTATI